VKRVPETVPARDRARRPISSSTSRRRSPPSQELAEYDAIIVGVPTRYGRMAAQMANFWDQPARLWASGALTGKVGSVFTSTATQHGGQETTLFSGITNLLHFGMVIVGLPYAFQGQMTLDEITGGSPYGATTIAGGQGQRQPSENELAGARFQGRHVAQIAAKLKG
jgi:NAD(P)H dehydrogenase (quinone)